MTVPFFFLNNGAKPCLSVCGHCVYVVFMCERTAPTASCESLLPLGSCDHHEAVPSMATRRLLCLCAFIRLFIRASEQAAHRARSCLHNSRAAGGEVTQEAGGGARAADGGGDREERWTARRIQ